MERIVWVDYAKSIGIFSVVLAHTPLYGPVQDWIYVFHMPLFFFLSGYLFSFGRHGSVRSFARVRFRQLMVPYVSFNVLSYLVWLTVLRHYGSGADSCVPWWSPLLNAFMGNGDRMAHNVPLWFFMCLYVVEMAYWVFFRNPSRRLASAAFFLVSGYAVSAFCPVRLPFSIGTALVGIVFYAAGQWWREHGVRRSPAMALAAFIITLAVACLNGRINMHVNYYGDYLLFLAGGFAGIYSVFYVCGFFRRSGFAEYVSRNTLTVCGLHLLTFSAIKFVMVYIMGVSPDILSGKVLLNVLFAAASMAVSLAAASVINKYFPFMTGRRRQCCN